MKRPFLTGLVSLIGCSGAAFALAATLNYTTGPDERSTVSMDGEEYIISRWKKNKLTTVGAKYGDSSIIDNDGDLNADVVGTLKCCDRYCGYHKNPANESDRNIFNEAISKAGIRKNG